MGVLNRDQLLKKEKLIVKKVVLSDKEFVYVRQMTGRERNCFEQSILKKIRGKNGAVTYEQSMNDFRAKLSVQVLCDKEGNNLLEPNDYEALSTNMSAARLEKIINVAKKLNNISDEDQEEIVKN